MASNNQLSLTGLTQQDNTANTGSRRPRDLQGLLNFCTEATKAEDTTQMSQKLELSDERKEFLEKVLSGLQGGGDLKIIADCLQILSSESISNESENIAEREAALEDLGYYVEDLNYANDVQKMNGFPIIVQCLYSAHASLQKKATNVIGNICQNNEQGQKGMFQLNVMPQLLSILSSHHNIDCKTKALFALSCLVREYEPAEMEFFKSSGFSYLKNAINYGHPKLLLKSCFLLNHFLQNCKDNTYKEAYNSMGFPEAIYTVLSKDSSSDELKDSCIKSFLNLFSSYPAATSDFVLSNLNIIDDLERLKTSFRQNEDFPTTCEEITELLQQLKTE